MNDLVKQSSDAQEQKEDSGSAFKGYTLEELRYQRAFIVLKKDFSQTKLLRNIDNIQKINPFSRTSKKSPFSGKYGVVASKLFSGLNYLDYAMLGFSLFGSVKKVYSFFNRKGRK